jgi:dipeptidyl aminopeptidase/acylaminoacyl peptidase
MMPDVRRYFTARKTAAPTLAPDGRLAFLADTTGTKQVWTADEAGAWPTQRTFYDERVSFVSWSPKGDAIAFGKDAGADEHDQLFVVDAADGSIDRLTNRPDAIHLWGGWSPDGEQIAFAANREKSSRFDIYTMAVGGEGESADAEAELVGRSDEDGFLGVEGWSPSGDRLVVAKAAASSDSDLFVVDVATGEREHVTPHEGHVGYHEPVFGPDGEALYCLSDANADTMELVRIDLDGEDHEERPGEDREERPGETVVEGGDWSIDGFALDAGSGRLAFTRNVEGYSELHVGRLTDSTTVVTEEVDLPEGVVHDFALGPDGDRVAASVSTPDLNHSVFVVDFSAGSAGDSPTAERWTRPSPGQQSLDAYDAPETVHYETFDVDGRTPSAHETESRGGREIPAYFTLPDGVNSNGVEAGETGKTDETTGETATDKVPVVVDIHGGPHHQRRPWFRPIRQYFLDAGYAVLEPNVRGSSGYGKEYAALDDVEKRMDSVRDIAEAVDWLGERPEIDSDGVVAYGRSYGGFMVLAAITEYPDLWAAAVDFVGIANWVTFLENTGDWRRSHREAEYGSLADDREFLESISPIHSVENIECPLFVQHGANDPRVPVGEARQIAEEVEAQGIPVETCIFEDEGHHTTKLDNRIEMFERIAAFLDEHVQ